MRGTREEDSERGAATREQLARAGEGQGGSGVITLSVKASS